MNWLPTGPLLLALLMAPVAAEAEEALPFSMPIPEGWRTETIPFPLGFAPDLPYEGLEELRFAPGMFEEGSPEFWTYTFVWWVADDDPTDTAALDQHLESYFRGLAAAVAPSRDIDLAGAVYSTSLVSTGDGRFSGTVETPDAFVTGDQVRLNVQGRVVECPEHGRKAAIFGLSPQESAHPIWEELTAVRSGFRCQAPVAVSSLSDLHSDPDVYERSPPEQVGALRPLVAELMTGTTDEAR